MADNGKPLRLSDGQFSWGAGVQSDTPRTKRIAGIIDDGVLQNQASWLINCSTRGSGILPRAGLLPVVQGASWDGLFQGGFLYQPDYGDPILIVARGGRIYRIRIDTDNSVTDLSTLYGVTLPADQPLFHFCQAEMWLIIQAGDLTTLPLFYDFGVEGIRPEVLRQSAGIVNPGVSDTANEIPAAGPMDYYGQRIFYAYGRGYAGGDISRNQTSGTAAYEYRDSVLKLTENPIAYGGDAFAVPTAAGDIRALAHASNIDSQLGTAQLFIFTRRAVYASHVPVTRDDWTAATTNLQPLQKVVLNKGGAYGDRCVVAVNGDLFFQGPPNGDIRSMAATQRQYGTWGSVPLSANINRALQFNDRSILRYASGVEFDNRLLQTGLPIEVTDVGVGHQCIFPLDFDTISTLEERRPPAWEGVWDLSGGPYCMQLFEGDFGGRERGFMVAWSLVNQNLEVWELRPDSRWDNTDDRITRVIEFPAYAFGNPLGLKELDSAEMWIDKMLGTVDFELFYRPDSYACWIKWHAWQKCAQRDCRDDPDNPCIDDENYPQELFCEQDAIPITIPRPKYPPCITGAQRPANLGFQFQAKLVIRGWCRVRAFVMYALWRERRPYDGLACHRAPTL